MHQNNSSLFAVSEVELIYRRKIRKEDRPQIVTSSNVYDIFLNAWDMNKIDLVEEFYILMLDRNLSCMGISKISTGGVSACYVDPKIVFTTALKARSTGLILAHNHPSGNLKPSHADFEITKRMIVIGKALDLPVQDHVIVTSEGYYSMAENRFSFD